MQNVIQGLAGLVFLATFAVPGLDRRFGESDVPLAVSLVGDVMIAAGFLIVFLTFRENTFTAGTIDAEGQHVIDSGPYAIVRQPMYAGALVMIVGVPLLPCSANDHPADVRRSSVLVFVPAGAQ